MILFYSKFCSHSKMLLEHIKRYDDGKIVKLVSIDDVRTTNANIVSKIPSVPALMIMPSKEILFGKNVFDYLLLPPRGLLCKGSTKSEKKTLDTTSLSSGISESEIFVPLNNNTESGDEPFSFSLGDSSRYSDNFSSIEDEMSINNNRNFRWNTISEENDDVRASSIDFKKSNNINTPSSTPSINDSINNDSLSSKKQGLPSIEELMQQRDKDIMPK